MNDAAPVTSEAPSRTSGSGKRLVSTRPGSEPGGADDQPPARASNQTTIASITLISPAVRIAPGRPIQGIRPKPPTSTPIAAPMLLVKYKVAIVSPESLGKRRTIAPLISGNVMPSSTDCGRMRIAAMLHLISCTRVSLSSPGSTVS